jgi:hypothetical protein
VRRTVSVLLAASVGSSVAGCALLVSFDGLDDGGILDASPDQAIVVPDAETVDSGTGGDTSPPESGGSDAKDSAPDIGAQDGDAGGGDAGPLFLGCFADSMTRDLPYQVYDSQANTTEACVTACISKGYRFAATQSGSQCFCGNAYGGQGPAGGCTTPCTGDQSEKCGGGYQNSVYVAIGPAPKASPVGCYADSMMTRELPDQVFGGPYMTVESCAACCAYRGYLYAGPEDGNQCFCGATYGTQGPSGGCNYPCAGNAKEICGGVYANSVYRTWVPADGGADSGDAGSD